MLARLLASGFDSVGGLEASLPYLTAVGMGIVLGGWGLWVQVNTFCGRMQVFGVEIEGMCCRT